MADPLQKEIDPQRCYEESQVKRVGTRTTKKLRGKKNVHLKYLAKIANTPFFKAKGCVRRKPNAREKSKMEKRKE